MDIRSHKHLPAEHDFTNISHWLVALGNVDELPELFKQRLQQRRKPEQAFLFEFPQGSRVAFQHLTKPVSAFEQLSLAADLFRLLSDDEPVQLGIVAETAEMGAALLEAALAGSFALPRMKSSATEKATLNRIDLFGCEMNANRSLATHEGNYLARCLSVLPSNQLTPAIYRQRIEALAQEHAWHMAFHDLDSLRHHAAGAFVAVAQGGSDDAGIVHLRYRPAHSNGKKLALVGKGICFDTGGHQVKSAKGMLNMHQDMQGSAVALGTLLALTRLQVNFDIDCWLALAENFIGPKAYKPHDVITTLNGTHVEIVHTDAEGRLVLADTLTLASREQPDFIIDYATLTGSCEVALGNRYCGAFTNRPALHAMIIETGQNSGERVWPFPLDKDYDEDLDSEVADIKQCTLSNDADHILAARFLRRFVNDRPWLHLDLSTFNRDGGLAHIPTATTGFGVRYSLRLLLDTGLFDMLNPG